jgi:hypothetical protein
VIFYETRHDDTQAHVTSGALCALSLAARTQTAAQFGSPASAETSLLLFFFLKLVFNITSLSI